MVSDEGKRKKKGLILNGRSGLGFLMFTGRRAAPGGVC